MILPVQCKGIQVISNIVVCVLRKKLCFCQSYNITTENICIKLDVNTVFSKRSYI